ncbi:MAG: hypothetical protein R6U04_14490 [Bacteroidales bacterium]
MIQIKKYDLPDFQIFFDKEKKSGCLFWVPDDYYIVLGNSNKPEHNLIFRNVINDEIEVYKRPSGGETVILSPNTLVFSVKVVVEKFLNPSRHFRYFNDKIIESLKTLGIDNLQYKGISDIAIGDRKILGSSIYRKRNILFYHAVLNIAEPVETIERYLKHPVKEPGYRKGRTHREFVTSLHNEGYFLSMEQLRKAIEPTLTAINVREIEEQSIS